LRISPDLYTRIRFPIFPADATITESTQRIKLVPGRSLQVHDAAVPVRWSRTRPLLFNVDGSSQDDPRKCPKTTIKRLSRSSNVHSGKDTIAQASLQGAGHEDGVSFLRRERKLLLLLRSLPSKEHLEADPGLAWMHRVGAPSSFVAVAGFPRLNQVSFSKRRKLGIGKRGYKDPTGFH